MSKVQKCPLCSNEVYYEHAETIYVCKTYCCPYTADFILHFRVADVLAARDAEIAKLREQLDDIRQRDARIMSEPCTGYDDVRLHCTCVPTLRAEIAKLRALLERVDGIVVSHDVLAWRRLKDDIRAALTEGGGE